MHIVVVVVVLVIVVANRDVISLMPHILLLFLCFAGTVVVYNAPIPRIRLLESSVRQ